MALSEIKKSNGAIKGRGLAIAAMAIPAATVILTIAIMAVSLCNGDYHGTKDIECLQSLKMIGLSMIMYTEDCNGLFPDSLDNSYIRECVGNDKVFVCPVCRKTGEKYELLSGIGGKSFKDFDNPQKTPVIICRHHEKHNNVLYADGHVSQIPKDGKLSQ